MAVATKDRTPSLLDLVAKATDADLAEIDQQITAKQTELEAACRSLESDLASLTMLRKLIDVKLHGKPARKVKQPRKGRAASNGHGDTWRQPDPPPAAAINSTEAALASQIVACITREGPLPVSEIARKLDRTPQGIRMALTKSARLFKQFKDGRYALPAAREPGDEDDD